MFGRRGAVGVVACTLAAAIAAFSGSAADAEMEAVPSGAAPHVRTFSPGLDGSLVPRSSFYSYAADSRNGAHVAVGDLDGDGSDETVTGAGFSGAPLVRVFRADGTALGDGFLAYPASFSGGVDVAVGDLDGDGTAEIITGAGPGGTPHVRAFSFDVVGGAATERVGFMAYDVSFSGGVQVTVGDLDGDGRGEIVTGPGHGGGPHVRVFFADGRPAGPGFFAYEPAFSGGVDVAAGSVDSDRRAEIVTGPGPGGGPHVRVVSYDPSTGEAQSRSDLFAYAANFSGGVRVATANVNIGSASEIVTGPGRGGGPHVRVFDGLLRETHGFYAYDPAFSRGIDVGGSAGGTIATGAGGARVLRPRPTGPVVYLTFDDGPSADYTPYVLETLARYDAKATFFEVGRDAAAWPHLRDAALNDGHTVGNHTWEHSDLTRLSYDEFQTTVTRTQEVLGPRGSRCLRPPYGLVNSRVRSWARQLNHPLVLWSIDTQDYKRPGTAFIVHTVLSRVTNGSVVLMHDGGGDRSQTVAALDQILSTLQARGYRFEPMCV